MTSPSLVIAITIALSVSIVSLGPAYSQVITPRKSDPTPAGEQSSKIISPADWRSVRRLAEAERRRADLQNRDRRRTDDVDSTGANGNKEQSGGRGRRLLEGVLDIAIDQAPGLASVDRANLPQFQNINTRELESTDVPVLVLGGANLNSARLFTTPISYSSINILERGVIVETVGTLARAVPQGSTFTRSRFAEREKLGRRLKNLDTDYVISRREDGINLSFSKFNVAYMISVTCEDTPSDPRCRDEAYVVSLASELTLLNEWQGGAR